LVWKSYALTGPRTSWIGPKIKYTGVSGPTNSRDIEAWLLQRAKGTSQVFSALMTYVYFNSADAAIVFTFRKNGADGNQTLSIPAGTTGKFQDAVNTDSVSTGDDLSTKIDVSAVTTDLGAITALTSYVVEDADAAVTYLQSMSSWLDGDEFVDGSTKYSSVNGVLSWPSAYSDYDNNYIRTRSAMTWDNLRVYVPTNENTKTTQTVNSYIFDAVGNQSISIPGTTGTFEDIVSSDSVAAGASLCIQVICPATGGTKNTHIGSCSSRLSNADGEFLFNQKENTYLEDYDPGYLALAGGRELENNSLKVVAPLDFNTLIDLFSLIIDLNSTTAATTLTLVYGTGTPDTVSDVTISVGAGLTGGFDDPVGSVSLSATPGVAPVYAVIEVDPPASGSIHFRTLSLRGQEWWPGAAYEASARLIGTVIASYSVQGSYSGTFIARLSSLGRLVG